MTLILEEENASLPEFFYVPVVEKFIYNPKTQYDINDGNICDNKNSKDNSDNNSYDVIGDVDYNRNDEESSSLLIFDASSYNQFSARGGVKTPSNCALDELNARTRQSATRLLSGNVNYKVRTSDGLVNLDRYFEADRLKAVVADKRTRSILTDSIAKAHHMMSANRSTLIKRLSDLEEIFDSCSVSSHLRQLENIYSQVGLLDFLIVRCNTSYSQVMSRDIFFDKFIIRIDESRLTLANRKNLSTVLTKAELLTSKDLDGILYIYIPCNSIAIKEGVEEFKGMFIQNHSHIEGVTVNMESIRNAPTASGESQSCSILESYIEPMTVSISDRIIDTFYTEGQYNPKISIRQVATNLLDNLGYRSLIHYDDDGNFNFLKTALRYRGVLNQKSIGLSMGAYITAPSIETIERAAYKDLTKQGVTGRIYSGSLVTGDSNIDPEDRSQALLANDREVFVYTSKLNEINEILYAVLAENRENMCKDEEGIKLNRLNFDLTVIGWVSTLRLDRDELTNPLDMISFKESLSVLPYSLETTQIVGPLTI